MKIQKIFLLLSLIISPLVLANATDDLLNAIEQGNVQNVEKAITQGADLDIIRTSDNHSAKSLAHSKILELAESKNSWIASLLASLSLPVMGFYQNPKYAFLSSAALASGLIIPHQTKNDILLTLSPLLGIGGILGLCSTAWTAPEKWQMITNSIGTAGLVTFLYFSYQLNKYVRIKMLVSPEEYQLTPENMQVE